MTANDVKKKEAGRWRQAGEILPHERKGEGAEKQASIMSSGPESVRQQAGGRNFHSPSGGGGGGGKAQAGSEGFPVSD